MKYVKRFIAEDETTIGLQDMRRNAHDDESGVTSPGS